VVVVVAAAVVWLALLQLIQTCQLFTSRMPNRAEKQSNLSKMFIIIIMTHLVCSPHSRGERG